MKYSIKTFHLDVDGDYTAEASMLGLPPGKMPLRLVLTTTGGHLDFSFSHTTTRDGDVMSWKYLPTTETIRKFPDIAKKGLIIFND